MEAEFEQAITNENQLSNMLHQYEVELNDQFGGGQMLNNRDRMMSGQGNESAADCEELKDNESSFSVFDQLQNKLVGDEKLDDWQQLTQKMQNPFTIMRRWLKFEILDLEAILTAVQTSNEMDRRMKEKVQQRNKDVSALRQLKDGRETIKTFFRSKEGKVNKITKLTEEI